MLKVSGMNENFNICFGLYLVFFDHIPVRRARRRAD
jgi:hypothetical protein